MQGEVDFGFRRIDSCVDYQSYLVPLEVVKSAQLFAAFRQTLLTLGKVEPERMGVTYVRGPWGFLVIPQAGFPELRVNFYHDTIKHEIDAVLASIAAALRVTDRAFASTGEDNE